MGIGILLVINVNVIKNEDQHRDVIFRYHILNGN
jgi:hypothetical protein